MPGMAPGMMQPVMMAPMMQQPPMMMMGPPTFDHDNYFALQRQVQDMEQPPEPKKPLHEVTSVEQLPLPKRTIRTTAETAAVKSNRPEVNIADQIAIRSFVLGQSLGKTGTARSE